MKSETSKNTSAFCMATYRVLMVGLFAWIAFMTFELRLISNDLNVTLERNKKLLETPIVIPPDYEPRFLHPAENR